MPDDLLQELAGFDWEGFYSDTRSCRLDATLGRILRHLPKARSRAWKAATAGSRLIAPFATPTGATWSELRIRFTSDFQVQVTVREVSAVRNYVEMGFEDRRAGTGPSKPDSSWTLFRRFAALKGVLQRADDVGLAWPKVETRVQTIRRRLRVIFRMPGDPIEYEHETNCYRTRFRLELVDHDRPVSAAAKFC